VLLVDANVLLYAVDERSAHHREAVTWLDRSLSENEAVGFAWVVVLAFLRLSTHPAIFPSPLAPEDALDVVRRWLAQPAATVVEPTPKHLDVLADLLASLGTGGNLVSDAHLAALALEHRSELVSYDADFDRFPGVRRRLPGKGSR
jgi:toxin-antitoxin system PIN domain toxin